jgi:GT2 family glycosyltransferase
MSPLVSVGIPSYNHAPYLREAVESVLGQTLADIELIVADDGSSDGSREILEEYARAEPARVTVLTHPGGAHRGLGPTVNLYRPRLTGRYILGLASDDVLYPDTLEREVDYLEANPGAGFVYGYAHRIGPDGRRLANLRTLGADVTGSGRAVERLVQGNKIPSMTAMIRRECLERVGPEHETLVYGDWEFYTRLAAHFDGGFIPRALAKQRIHGANTSTVVARETNLRRAIEVTAYLRENAERIGGGLAAPRVRATLELQTAFLGFAAGEAPEAGAARLRSAFERDPTLARDGEWLAEWLWNRLVDALIPASAPPFVEWLGKHAGPLLDPDARRTFAREAQAAAAAERAIRLARAGRTARAQLPALAALLRAPRRMRDRHVAAALLDPVAGGLALRGYLRARQVLAPRR